MSSAGSRQQQDAQSQMVNSDHLLHSIDMEQLQSPARAAGQTDKDEQWVATGEQDILASPDH